MTWCMREERVRVLLEKLPLALRAGPPPIVSREEEMEVPEPYPTM